MKAAVWHDARDIRVDDVSEPGDPTKGRVVVEVSLASICASDVAEYRDGPHVIPVARPHPLTGQCAPVILGHEFTGRVISVGDDVESVSIGDRVCGDACLRCGHCYWCIRGEYNICKVGGSIGFHADGAFAPLVDLPAYALYAVPDEITDRYASIVEPMAVGLHALHQGDYQAGESVVVIGYGMIGAAVAVMSSILGAGRLVVVEPNPHRAMLASASGFVDVLAGTADLRREVRSRTSGIGADVVVDCSGTAATLPAALELARRGGRVVVCGITHDVAQLAPERLVYFERKVVGALGYRNDHPAVIDLMRRGLVNVDALFGEPIPLADIIEDGFERAMSDPSCPLRIPVVTTDR